MPQTPHHLELRSPYSAPPGFRIQRKRGGDGRRVVLTYSSKQALAAVMHKIRKSTGRGTTSLRLADVLRVVNRSFGVGLPTSATACPNGRSPTSPNERGGG